jgi:hypothetical protein
MSAARHAFETGALTEDDWPIRDQVRGFNQYNDCLIIQLIVTDVSQFDDALAPLIRNNSTWTASCATLHKIVGGKPDAADSNFRYSRYWHGYVPITTFFLSVSDLDVTRSVLKCLVYLSLLLLAACVMRRPLEMQVFAWSVAAMAALFWAVPYFGQSLSHAPGDAFLMLGLAGFLYFSDCMRVSRALLPYSAAYGAAVAYLEFWTGQLPTAAGFLFVAAYLVAVTRRTDGEGVIDAWIAAGASVLAFLAGAAITVALKQLLAAMLTDAPVLTAFAEVLSHYSGVTLSNGPWLRHAERLSGFLPLLRSSATLTYWSEAGALGLAIGVIAVWCGVGTLAWFRRSEGSRPISDFLSFAMAASIPFIWAFIFYVHTALHAIYMSRILILPVALGAAIFCHTLLRAVEATQKVIHEDQ